MNECTYHGQGHTIHTSGQIEWSNNSVDDKSIQVCGKQGIITIDGYTMPQVSKEGLLYLELIGKPTKEDLSSYPPVHPSSPHKWDPTMLDYATNPNRSLPSWTLLAVLLPMCHVWITDWIVSGFIEATDRPSYTKEKSTILHVFMGFVIMADQPCLEHLQGV